jgi:hypothetical protein
MGLFSNRCEALVDRQTGMALSGEALRAARDTKGWPVCGHRVSKKAKICSKCGAGAPGGWFRCAACGKWIGNDSNFCPHCSARLHPDTRVDMSGGVWEKDGAVFAQRFEVGDVARLLKQENLQVQEGTVALLLDGGKLVKRLEAGRHNPASLARTVNWFGNPPPRSLIMVDAGDVRLPIEIEGLRSAEKIPLTFAGDLVLRFDAGAADEFVGNGLKGRRELTYAALGELLAGEVRAEVQALCAKTPMADLAFDPERRKRLTEALREGLKRTCGRLGIAFSHVATADFEGEEYEKLVEAEGGLALKRRELEFSQAMRETLSRERMHEFKTEGELKAYAATLAQEYRIGELHRQREERVLVRGWNRQDELEDLRHGLAKETEELEHALRVARKDREERLEEARTKAEEGLIAAKAGHEIARNTLELDAQLDRQEAEQQERRAKIRKGMTLEERLQDERDPGVREHLLELQRIDAQKHSATTAAQLAGFAEREKVLREMVERADRANRDAREHDREMARIWVEPATKAADRKGDGNTNIVK